MAQITILLKPADASNSAKIEESLKTIYYGLNADDLQALSDNIKTNPKIVSKFKTMLNNPMVRRLLG